MWLLDTSTLLLERFIGDDVPPYAILSHRWEEDEASFRLLQEYQAILLKPGETLSSKTIGMWSALRELRYKALTSSKGWSKVTKFCEEAKRRGFTFAWIDTACIDQSSSAELQEAINSMFKWYTRARVCIAYLNDVDVDKTKHYSIQLCESKWFTRGWTLQEFLATLNRLRFVDCNWRHIGSDTEMRNHLAKASGIPEEHLSSLRATKRHISSFSIAQKFSWASRRTTTKPEDMAYCLLGLLDVNIPLLYGEGGERAFFRLQEELMRTSDDESLFACSDEIVAFYRPIFARTPAEFYNSGEVCPLVRFTWESGASFRMVTPQGIRMEMILIPYTMRPDQWPDGYLDRYRVLLHSDMFESPIRCEDRGQGSSEKKVAVFLTLQRVPGYKSRFRRVGNWYQKECDWKLLAQNYPPREITVMLD